MKIPFLEKYVSNRVAAEVYEFANEVYGTGKEPPRKPDPGEYTWSLLTQMSAAKVRQRMGVYNPETITDATFTKMGKHHQIAFGLAFVRLPLESVEWWIECENEEIRTFLTQAVKDVWRALIRSCTKALEFGYAPHEIVWRQEANYRVWDKDLSIDVRRPVAYTFDRIKAVEPQYCTLKLDGDRYAGFEQMSGGDIEAEKSFWFTHDERFGNLYGRSRLVPCYDPWYWSSIIVAFCNRYLERFGTPATVGKAPEGDTETHKDESGNPVLQNNLDLMQAAGEALQEKSVVTLPATGADEPGWSLDYLTDDKRGSEFSEILNKYDTWMLRGLFVPERSLTQDSEVGSNSMADTHANMFLLSEESLLGDVLDAVNRQLIPNLLLYNYGPDAPRAEVCSKGFTDERKQLVKEIFIEMIKGGRAQPATEELARELGVPMAEGSSEEDKIDSTPAEEDGAAPGDDGEPEKEDLRDAAQTLNEAHREVKRLLSERKLQDVCSC